VEEKQRQVSKAGIGVLPNFTRLAELVSG
jgi:hypothetical protein